jgi:hypothetical protein
MFSTPRRFIKTGIGFLGAGLALGVWILVKREMLGVGAHPYLVSAHVHAVGVGFVMFLILGVAQWLFPRAHKDDSRYRPGRIHAQRLGDKLRAVRWALPTGSLKRSWRRPSRLRTVSFIVLLGGASE